MFAQALFLVWRVSLRLTRAMVLLTRTPSQLLTADWTTVDSDFAYFMAMNVPWCSSDFQVAPAARLGDGSIDLVWIENGTRSKVLRVLLDTESGTYVHEPYVRSERVQAFLLEPDCTQPFGILDLDGEAISYGATLVQMLPQCMRLLVPTGHDENVWQKSGK